MTPPNRVAWMGTGWVDENFTIAGMTRVALD